MFAVNIAGVLADAQIIDQTTYSWEWDENWEAKTARTKTGWSAEIRIPLRVLRFDSKLPVQSWGFQASRFIAQREETDIVGLRPARRRGADRLLRTPRRPPRPQGGRRAGAAAVRARLRPAARRQPDGGRQRHLGQRLGRPRSQVAHRPGPHLRRRPQPGLLPGRARPDHPEPRHLRDVPAGEAPVFPGGDRRLLVPDAGLLFAPDRQRAGGAVAAERRLQQRRAGRTSRRRRRSTAPGSWSAASAPTGRSAR